VKRLLFVPGPGFSAYCEARALGPRLERSGWHATFWDDPSHVGAASGPPPTFDEYLERLESALRSEAGTDLTIACHSGAISPVLLAMQRTATRAGRIMLIAPALAMHDTFCRVLRLAAADFDDGQHEKSRQIRALLQDTRVLMDEPMQQGLAIAAGDERLFSHYWRDEVASKAYAEAAAIPSARFRPDTFFAVIGGLASRSDSHLAPAQPLAIPAVALFAGADPVIDPAPNLAAARTLFGDLTVHTFEGVGHWIHLERPDAFLKLLNSV
jgi:pimeloyl-ACP methyl ester carboxylesterase